MIFSIVSSDYLALLFAFAFGLLIGSFLNVCIYRWPRDLSVIRPRSHCGECGHLVAWYDNIPLASYTLLRGRCRHCLMRISWRYPAAELLTAVLFAACALKWGVTPLAAKSALFAAMLVCLMFADLETRLLPDEITKGGIVLGLILAWLVPLERGLSGAFLISGDPRWISLGEAAIAAALTSGALWLSGYLFSKIRKRDGLGFGDVKMVAMMGAFLGVYWAFVAIFAGCLAGSILGILYVKLTRKDASSYELPFATFLGAGGLWALFR